MGKNINYDDLYSHTYVLYMLGNFGSWMWVNSVEILGRIVYTLEMVEHRTLETRRCRYESKSKNDERDITE